MHASSRQRTEVCGYGEPVVPFGLGKDGARKWMLALGLDAARQTQQFAIADTFSGGDADDDVRALRQRAGLVKQHCVKEPAALKRQPVFDQNPVAGRERTRDRGGERYRKPKCMRAGDHEHGDDPHYGGVGLAHR